MKFVIFCLVTHQNKTGRYSALASGDRITIEAHEPMVTGRVYRIEAYRGRGGVYRTVAIRKLGTQKSKTPN